MLGVDAAFDRRAKEAHVVLRDRQRRASRDLDLFVDDVDAGDHLGDGMLDLDARVHLDEVEVSVLIKELDRPGADIAEFRHGAGHHAADLLALFGIERGGGAFFPDLLMAALERTVALSEMDGAALSVAEHLDLDMARLGEIFLEIDRSRRRTRSWLRSWQRRLRRPALRDWRRLSCRARRRPPPP